MADINIFVVDDQHLVRTGLVRMLGDMQGLSLRGDAGSGEEALDKIATLAEQQQLPDVVLMDMRMPGIGGLEATRKLTHRYPTVRVIAVTGCSETPFPQRFLESGASGFITKDAGIDEVVRAIAAVSRGKRYISQDVAQEIALNAVNTALDASPFEKLSERELQIAMMVIDGVKTGDIATQLHVSPKTVNTYRYRLFEKLNIKSNMELAMLANRYGILDVNESRKL